MSDRNCAAAIGDRANASGTIKRSDFGMKFGIPSVGDEQKLWIEMEGFKD